MRVCRERLLDVTVVRITTECLSVHCLVVTKLRLKNEGERKSRALGHRSVAMTETKEVMKGCRCTNLGWRKIVDT